MKSIEANSELYTTTSAEELTTAVNNASKKVFPAITGSKELFTYDSTGKTIEMLEVPVSNGLGGILASGINTNTTLEFTDNAFRDSKGVLTDVNNFNTWIRKELDLRNKANLYEADLLYTIPTRQPGTVFLTGNYELQAAMPIDARMLTDTLDSLISPKWWITSFKRPVYLYNGLVVAVKATKELYMYTGIDICVANTDPTTERAISIDKWKRVSFKVEDVMESPLLILSNIDAYKHNGIRTGRITGWKSDNVKYISSETNLYDLGATFATDYILLGSHYQNQSDYSVHRTIYNIYQNSDNFVGLSIIPNLPHKQWDANSFKGSSEGVELQSVVAPLLLKYKYLSQNGCIRYYATNSMIFSREGISISAPDSSININAKTLDLTSIPYITFGSVTLNSDYAKFNVKNSTLLKSGMLTMEINGGTYLSSGDETNIVAGAFAIHTTGYTVTEVDNANSILMNPVSFDYRKGVSGSKQCMCNTDSNNSNDNTNGEIIADYVKINDLSLSNKEQTIADNTVGSVNYNKLKKADNLKTASTDFPGISLYSSAADFTKNDSNGDLDGFIDSGSKGATIPPTTSANFNRTHNANLRLTPSLVAQFKYEVDNGNILLIDLSDKSSLANSKKLVYADTSVFNTQLRKELSLLEGNQAEKIDNTKLKILNTDSALWVNTDAVITDTGNKASLTKGYAMVGTTQTFNESMAQSITELLNNGTVSIESFGDVSIYSNFGQIKLGTDGFVRTNRKKYFIVENEEESYIRATPNGLDIVYKGTDMADITSIKDATGTVYDVKDTLSKGYIHLDAGIISLWDGYVLEKPVGNDQVLTYSSSKNNGKALCWKTQTNVTGSINDNGVYPDKVSAYMNPDANAWIIESGKYSGMTVDEWEQLNYNNRYNTYGNYYKIGTLEYKSIEKDAEDNESGSLHTFIENNVIVINSEVQVNLSCGAYSGDINVAIQIYNNGQARVTVNDATLKFANLLIDNGQNPLYINSPLSFYHTPSTSTKNGLIEFFVFVPNNMDCHWSIHSTKEELSNHLGYCQWVHVPDTSAAVTGTKAQIISKLPYIDQYNETTGQFKIELPNDVYNLDLVYTLPLLMTGTFGNSTNNDVFANKVVEVPTEDNENGYNLQYKQHKITWEKIDTSSVGGITKINTISSDMVDVAPKTYLMGAYDPNDYDKLPDQCKENCNIHQNIYFDPAGDLHASNFYNVSDIQLKKDIEPILKTAKLPELKQFKFKSNDELSYGFIALEVEDAGYKELIHTDDAGYKRVNYIAAYAIMFKLMQDEIKALKDEIKQLKNK